MSHEHIQRFIMAETFEGWDEEEWHEWVVKLDKLSLEQLKSLAAAVGISFGDRQPESKDAYILVLDEADPKLLEEKYNSVL